MKGLFIPEITAEMFRNGCLESIEALMAEGEICDIDYEPEPRWIPVTERLPENKQDVLVTVNDGCTHVEIDYFTGAHFLNYWDEVLAWMPLPEPWKGEEG